MDNYPYYHYCPLSYGGAASGQMANCSGMILANQLFEGSVYVEADTWTHFDLKDILVWATPIPLIIDAGSMIRIFFLIMKAAAKSIEIIGYLSNSTLLSSGTLVRRPQRVIYC